MADLRIYELTDTQASYSTGIYCQVDNSGFANTKKMDIGTIYPLTNTLSAITNINPATALLRIDNAASGTEEKITVNNMLTDSDVAVIIQALFTETAWLNGTRTYSGVEANSFICKVKQVGKMITVSGQIRMASHPPLGEVLITLPATIKTCAVDIFFISGDDSADDRNTEMKVAAGTRTIKAVTGDGGTSDKVQSYFVTYPADDYLD